MATDRPVLLLCPVRNSIDELRRSLPTWELIADKIIVADQGSTDGSREFLQSHEKVVLIENIGGEYNEVTRNALLVTAARKIHPEAIHLSLDADEILSSNVLSSPELNHFRRMEPGTVAGPPGQSNLAFVDDGRPVEGKKRMHEQRGVGGAAS